MFSLRRFIQLSVAAAVAVFVVACSGGDKSTPSKGNMIPDNAVVALKVDFDQLLNKALGDENSPIRDYWNMAKSAMAGQARGYGELGELARNILKDPALSGVDVTEPVVLSCSYDMQNISHDDPSVDVYLVALLDDEDAFVKVVDAAVAFVNEEEGLNITKEELGSYTYYEIMSEYDSSIDLGVSSKAAILRIRDNATDDGEGLKDSFLALFTNGGPEKTKGLKKFYDADEEVAVWVAIDSAFDSAMPLLEEECDPEALSKFQAYAEIYNGASAVADLSFNNGKTVVNYNLYGSALLKEAMGKYVKPASDKYLKMMPDSPAVVLNVAIKDFAGLVDLLCAEDEDFQEMFEEISEEYSFDKELLKGFPGNISVAVDAKRLSYRSEPGVMVCLETDKKVWRYAESYITAFADREGDDTYLIDDEYYVFYEGDHITFVDSETMSTAPMSGANSFAETEFGAQIKKGGMFVDLAAIPARDLEKYVRREFGVRMTREQILDLCSSAVLTTSDDFMSATLTVNMNDKDHNLLEKIALTAVSSF